MNFVPLVVLIALAVSTACDAILARRMRRCIEALEAALGIEDSAAPAA